LNKIYNFGVLLMALSLVTAYVIIPLLIKSLGYDSVIYLQSIEPQAILQNLGYIFIFLFIAYIFRFKNEGTIRFRSPSSLNYYSSIILSVWVLSFLLLGGLTYRETDVDLGYGSRGFYLDFILSLYNVMIIIALSIINRLEFGTKKTKLLDIFSVVSFLVLLIFSGSRGIFIQFIITYAVMTVVRADSAQLRKNFIKRYFKWKYITLLAVIISIFIGVGFYRDNYSNFEFETLFRLSEPYWFMSYIHSSGGAGDPSILIDSFERISYTVTNIFGSTITGSIEGSDYYIYKYLDIEFVEGRSLPITLFGFGYLLNSYYGVAITLFFAFLFLKVGFKLNSWFSQKILWGYEYLICFATSCILLYAKSLSGVFQVLIYEKFRDFVYLFILTMIWYIIKKKIIF